MPKTSQGLLPECRWIDKLTKISLGKRFYMEYKTVYACPPWYLESAILFYFPEWYTCLYFTVKKLFWVSLSNDRGCSCKRAIKLQKDDLFPLERMGLSRMLFLFSSVRRWISVIWTVQNSVYPEHILWPKPSENCAVERSQRILSEARSKLQFYLKIYSQTSKESSKPPKIAVW